MAFWCDFERAKILGFFDEIQYKFIKDLDDPENPEPLYCEVITKDEDLEGLPGYMSAIRVKFELDDHEFEFFTRYNTSSAFALNMCGVEWEHESFEDEDKQELIAIATKEEEDDEVVTCDEKKIHPVAELIQDTKFWKFMNVDGKENKIWRQMCEEQNFYLLGPFLKDTPYSLGEATLAGWSSTDDFARARGEYEYGEEKEEEKEEEEEEEEEEDWGKIWLVDDNCVICGSNGGICFDNEVLSGKDIVRELKTLKKYKEKEEEDDEEVVDVVERKDENGKIWLVDENEKVYDKETAEEVGKVADMKWLN